MLQKGIATFGLDYGKCPRWLFDRMVRLGREMVRVIVEEYGQDEFIKRVADPVWFQSLGTVLAFDWNSSGLTTILTAALKEAVRGQEQNLGIFICGGKGKTSRKTPEEIEKWGEVLSLPGPYVNNLIYNSKMAAKVDNSLVQDGFQIYHHSFFFSKNKAWTVVQQGMNTENQTARRYHWHSEKITDLVCEPHSGIISQLKTPTLNLTAKKSGKTRQISTELVQGSYAALMKDIRLLRGHFSGLSQTLSLKFGQEKATFLHLENREFYWHPVLLEDFSPPAIGFASRPTSLRRSRCGRAGEWRAGKSKYLEKILWRVCQEGPENYEKLLSLKGVGPKTIRALSLVSEVIYGAKPSYEDPARYSFAHGGKDATPYPVDRQTFDSTIDFFKKVVQKMRIPFFEKRKILTCKFLKDII